MWVFGQFVFHEQGNQVIDPGRTNPNNDQAADDFEDSIDSL